MKRILDNMEAVMFDSGRVLNVPQTGHWFISPEFFSYIDKAVFENIVTEKRNLAFSRAGDYIKSIVVITTKQEEYEHFIKYYEIFSDELPELKLTKEKICELAKDLVYNVEKYRFYDDAFAVIPILNKKYKLAVVSDAWPSLRDVFIHAGLFSYFSAFVISSEIGVTKPNEKMYSTSLDGLKVKSNKAIFIDDNLNNCMGAKKLGIKPVLLCRDKRYYFLQKFKSIGRGYRVINSLDELLK